MENDLPLSCPSAEKVILQVGGKSGKSFDLGALCYKTRETFLDGRVWFKTGKRVVLESLDAERVLLLNKFLEYLFLLRQNATTKYGICEQLSQFIIYCESINKPHSEFNFDTTEINKSNFERLIFEQYKKNNRIHAIWDFYCHIYEIQYPENQLSLRHWYKYRKKRIRQHRYLKMSQKKSKIFTSIHLKWVKKF